METVPRGFPGRWKVYAQAREFDGVLPHKKGLHMLDARFLRKYARTIIGRLACTNKGLALMALKTRTPVVAAFSVRQKDGRYGIIIEGEVKLQRSGNKIRDVEENTALFSRVIEKYVLHYPDQWFWFHRRWKTKNYCPLPWVLSGERTKSDPMHERKQSSY